MTMIGSHENRKSQNGERKKPPMLFLNLCTDLDLEKQKQKIFLSRILADQRPENKIKTAFCSCLDIGWTRDQSG
jgi:hypothetical protein